MVGVNLLDFSRIRAACQGREVHDTGIDRADIYEIAHLA